MSSMSRRLTGIALVAPATLVVLGLVVYPLAYDIWISVADSGHGATAGRVGLHHYRQLATDPIFWQAARNTAGLVVVTALIELVIGVLTALLLWWRFWGRTFVFVSVFVPWAFPATFSAFAWYWLLIPPFPAFYTPDIQALRWQLEGVFGMGAWQVLSMAIMNVWRGSSIIAIFLLAGFNSIPEELLDVGRLDARNVWSYFWHVIAPLARRFLVLATLVAVVITYVEYASMYIETGGRITVPVLGTLAYREAVHNGNAGLAAALSLIPVPFAALLVAACFRLLERRPGHAAPMPDTAEARSPARPGLETHDAATAPHRPRWWRGYRLALTMAGILAAVAVAVFHLFPVYYTGVQAFRSVPEYALANPFWAYDPTLEDIEEVIRNPRFWQWSWNTFVVFGSVLVVGLTISLLAGYGLARFAVPGGRWLARLMFFGYFVPPSAILVPVFLIFSRWDLDDSLAAVALLYLTLTIPFATWLFYTYFQGLGTEAEEHALLDGNRIQVFFRIVLPMSAPVVIAAGLFAIGMMGADVLYASVFSLGNATKTLPAGLGLTAVELDEWASANAAILLSSLPIVLGCAALSRFYVRGLRAALIEGA